MINIVFRIAFFFVDIIYFFIKLCPTRHKVVFLSRQDNKPSVDFTMVEEKLHQMDDSIETVMLCRTLDGGIINKIKYVFHMFEQMYHIATSEVAVLDDYCIVISNLHHKKNLTVIQMWHGLSIGKKFGYSVIGKEEGSSETIAKAMRMHKNYDMVFGSSSICLDKWKEAFRIEDGQFVVAPQPRIDLLRDENYLDSIRKKILQVHPVMSEKKNILYAPTFRKDESLQKEKIQEFIDSVDYSRYNLIVSLHPVTKFSIDDERVITDRNFSSFQLATVADKVITDYSATVYEVALMNKEIYYYVFDQDQYLNYRGFYMDVNEFPGPRCSTASELIAEIEKEYDSSTVSCFLNKYIDQSVNNCTEHIAEIILKCKK